MIRFNRLSPVMPGMMGEFGGDRTTGLSSLKLGVPIMLIGTVWLWSGPLLRLVDPVAAVVDLGVLSLLLLGLLSGVGFIAASSWLLGLLWPVFRDFRHDHFEPIFKSLLPWQKIVIYLCCFFLLLYAFVACLAAVF